mmetsp:Transcript_16013/g.18279  ORF Transcript_16013/g.18279 Transcript_16013/m.18279 type:complete len:154 (+) Transcript_16013:1158-1619(+)
MVIQQVKEPLRIKTTRNAIRTIRMLTTENNHHPSVMKRKGADPELEMITNLMIIMGPVVVTALVVVVDSNYQIIKVNKILLHRVLNKQEIREDITHDLLGNNKIININMSRDDDDDDGDNYDNLRNNVYCALCDESEGRAKKCPRYEAFQTKN